MIYSLRPALALIASFAVSFSAAPAAPVRVVSEAAPPAVQPQIAVAPDGAIHMVFGRGSGVYHTRSADGRTFSPAVKVGELEKLALGMRRGPRISATDKVVAVTAISHADGMLHAWISADGGATWDAGSPINSAPNSAREGMHAMAGDGRGTVVVTWLDLRNKGMELWSRVSRDGGLTWRPEVRVYASPDGHICECCQPSVGIGPRGEIAAMWRNWLGGSRDLYLATSRDGRTFSPAQKLGTGTWKLNGCPMDGGSLAFAPGGNWLAVWRRERAIFATEATLPESQLAPNAVQPVVGFAGTTRLKLWEANGALMLQRGAETPVRFAESAASAAIVGEREAAAVVWESGEGEVKTLLFDRIH